MLDARIGALDENRHRRVFDRLATDGWVEKISASSQQGSVWVTAHDVLADQILLSYVRGVPDTADKFLAELFSLAARLGCVKSAIVSLQRVADSAPLNAGNWRTIIGNGIAADPVAWREIRHLLLSTTLLSVTEQIGLLASYPELWIDSEKELKIQKRLGWLARSTVIDGGDVVPEGDKKALISWVTKACYHADRSNFVITWALRLAPEQVRDVAMHWIVNRPIIFQTHYLLVAWLKSGLPANIIARWVQRWIQRFPTKFQLSYLLVAWLDAGGDPVTIRAAVLEWFQCHKHDLRASFLFAAWLNSGGDHGLVSGLMREWLSLYKADNIARQVYKAWLNASGDKRVVWYSIREWLVSHQPDLDASRVYTAWLDAGGDTAFIQSAMDNWLQHHKTTVSAQYVLTAWLRAGGNGTLVQSFIGDWLSLHKLDVAAGYLYNSWLDAKGDLALVRSAINEWLSIHSADLEANHVFKAWLDAGGDKDLVKDAIADWLIHHRKNLDAQFAFNPWLDAGGDPAFVQQAVTDWLEIHQRSDEASHVYKAWLDAGGDPQAIRATLQEWLSLHRTDTDLDFVLRAWSDAGGDWDLIRGSVLEWLSAHKTEEVANYVLKLVAKQSDLPPDTISDILEWCRLFSSHEDAMWRFTQLREKLFTPGLEENVIITAEALLHDHIKHTSRPVTLVKEQIVHLISYLIKLSMNLSGPLRERVDAIFVSWLRHPDSFGPIPKPHWTAQRVLIVKRFALLIDAHVLDLKGDASGIVRFLRWIDVWDPKWKQRVEPILDELRRGHPAPSVWGA